MLRNVIFVELFQLSGQIPTLATFSVISVSPVAVVLYS